MNGLILQAFEWYLPDNGDHYKFLTENLQKYKDLGFTAIWLPPACKATGTNDVGYGIYDLYDLGEFDQKGSVRTKYGTREDLENLITKAHELGLAIYADVVLNHKAAADEKETFMAVEVARDNREQEIGEPHDIEAWTKFTFPGRDNKYSEFKWNHEHFSGVDYDDREGKSGIFKIIGENKGWSWSVAGENGNFDYLMFADIDHNHPDVRDELFKWSDWFIEEFKIDGFRYDASKHIDARFMDDLNGHLVDKHENFYAMAEYWMSDNHSLQEYMEDTSRKIDLFDVPLHFNFFTASQAGSSYDMRRLFDNAIVQTNKDIAVTFVDNHDTQEGQSLQSWVKPWFKEHAYATILLRQDGYPTVFFGDLYGIGNESEYMGIHDQLVKLLELRRDFAYGQQDDYMDDPNTIGFVRKGNEDHPGSLAVVMTNGDAATLTMYVGKDQVGKVFVDKLGNNDTEITIKEDGCGDFFVSPGSVSAWIEKI